MHRPYSQPETAPKLSDLFSLKDRTALVVGGSGLLGGEISYALAELDCRIIIASRNIVKCQEFAQKLAQSYPHDHVGAMIDLQNSDSITSLAEQVFELCNGKLDILVNCGWSGKKNSFDSITDDDWNYDIEICLNGVFRTIKACVPMLETSEHGTILNIASMYGHVSPDYRIYDGVHLANPPSYGAAKAGVIQLTKYLSSFLSPKKIRVNAISPGPFPFEQTQTDNPDFIKTLAGKNPLGRIGQPHDIKAAAVLLCSDAGAYMTGQNLCVDGGWSVW